MRVDNGQAGHIFEIVGVSGDQGEIVDKGGSGNNSVR